MILTATRLDRTIQTVRPKRSSHLIQLSTVIQAIQATGMLNLALRRCPWGPEMPYTCPACGYPDLAEEPRGDTTGGSFEICPSCGIQFGLDDEVGGDPAKRHELYRQWRRRWIGQGTPWRSAGIARPKNWNPSEQLKKLLEK
jgi:hypothetical protein